MNSNHSKTYKYATNYLLDVILVVLLKSLIFLFWLLPQRCIFLLSDFFAWMLYRVFKYSRKIIDLNLDFIFPKLTDYEKNKIIKLIYKNLTDNICDTLKGWSMSQKKLSTQIKMNLELINQLRSNHETIFIASSHFANWEMFYTVNTLDPGSQYNFVYKALQFPLINNCIKKYREKYNATCIERKSFKKIDLTQKTNKLNIYLFICDQRPHAHNKSQDCIQFFDKSIKCISGYAGVAKKYNIPICYLHSKRDSRGCYTYDLSLITNNPSSLSRTEICQKVFNLLENDIIKSHADWMWIYNRFNHPINYKE